MFFRNKRNTLGLIFLFFITLKLSCSASDEASKAELISSLSQEESGIYEKTEDLKRIIFSYVDSSQWELALIGSDESILSDLCDMEEDSCSYSSADFRKLLPGDDDFDALNAEGQALVTEINDYFTGDKIIVYDDQNKMVNRYLNSISPKVGNHELGLVRKTLIEPLHLHTPSYGKVYWPKGDSDGILLEAFAGSGCS